MLGIGDFLDGAVRVQRLKRYLYIVWSDRHMPSANESERHEIKCK